MHAFEALLALLLGATILSSLARRVGWNSAPNRLGPEARYMSASSKALPGITVRPAASADLPALGKLGALLVSLHHEFDPDRFIGATPNTEPSYSAFLGGELKRSNVVVLVAEGSGAVLGYTYAGIEGNDYMALRGPAGVLYDLVVDPGRRSEGIGRLLLDTTLAALMGRGARRVVLSTAERNQAAQRLFASQGFRRTMIEMTRELRDPEPPAKYR